MIKYNIDLKKYISRGKLKPISSAYLSKLKDINNNGGNLGFHKYDVFAAIWYSFASQIKK